LNHKKIRDIPARFDVVAVDLSSSKPRIEVIQNAFDLLYE